MDAARLTAVPLFGELPKKELRGLSRFCDEVEVPAGTHLVREGEFAYEFFAILDGAARVTHGGRRIADLERGDFFGEMGSVGRARRSATVVAESPTTLVVMT